MKPEQSVLNKLAKFSAKEVELSAEPMKVEFALVDDIRARTQALQKDLANLAQISNEVMKARQNAIKMISSISDTISAQQKEINSASQSMKELGIDTDILKSHNDKVGEALQEIKSISKQIGL